MVTPGTVPDPGREPTPVPSDATAGEATASSIVDSLPVRPVVLSSPTEPRGMEPHNGVR